MGDILFAPGYTYYHRQLQAQTYGVAELLVPGENVLRVYLGAGIRPPRPPRRAGPPG